MHQDKLSESGQIGSLAHHAAQENAARVEHERRLRDSHQTVGIASTGITGMEFGEAFYRLRHDGHRLARRGWNGQGMWIALQTPDAQSKMTLPYIFMHTAQSQRIPWVASQTDILAADWYLV